MSMGDPVFELWRRPGTAPASPGRVTRRLRAAGVTVVAMATAILLPTGLGALRLPPARL
jgi:hypothetical protein